MPEEKPIEGEIVESGAEEVTSSELAVPANFMPGTLYLLPLAERPFFPAQTLPLLIRARGRVLTWRFCASLA